MIRKTVPSHETFVTLVHGYANQRYEVILNVKTQEQKKLYTLHLKTLE